MAAPQKPQPALPSQFPLRSGPSSDSTLRRSSDALHHGSNPEPVPYSSSNALRHGTNPEPVPYSPTGDDSISQFKNGNDSPGSDSEEGEKPAPPVSKKLTGPRAWLGLQPVAPVQEDHDHAHHNHLAWSKIKVTLKEPMAEFWGTFILVLFGDAALAQVMLGTVDEAASPGGFGYGHWQSVSWAWGLGLMLGVYVAGDSGAYLNPCITFASCVLRKLPWRRLPVYVLAQTLGAFCAAGVVYGNYYSLIDAYEGGPGIRTVPPAKHATAGIFATYPSAHVSYVNQIFSQFIGSFLLVFIIWALKDDSNKGNFIASGAWFPLGLFFTMFGISACFGMQTGFAINFARDVGPRLMTWAVGYGTDVWTTGDYYFWIPMFIPWAGCLCGGITYDMFIYMGETPINTPYFGLSKLLRPKKTISERLDFQQENGMV